MFKQWLDRIASSLEPDQLASDDTTDLERVSALLLIEIARADHDIAETEKQAISAALLQASSLSEEDISAILGKALEDAETAVSLHEHISLVNEKFDRQAKLVLVEQMWRVAVADGDIDKYEEYTIRKLCDLLFLKHSDFMQSKLRVIAS